MACRDGELSVLFTDDRHIAELNRDYLGRVGPTNVLAFSMSGGPPPDVVSGMLGDVVVSVERAIEESKTLGEPFEQTIYRLLIHGILHLLDYDHERSREQEQLMERKQQELLSLIEKEQGK